MLYLYSNFLIMKFLVNLFLLIFLTFNFACKNDNSVKKSDFNDKLPQVLRTDSLINSTNVEIKDTFANNNPKIVHFIDKNDNNKVYEKQYYESGKLFMEGVLIDGKRDGKWVAYYETGVFWSTGYYKEGLKHGKSNVYYENGKVRYTKNYENDIAQGLWQFFDENGKLLKEINFKNGKEILE